MEQPFLVEPSSKYKEAYLDMLSDWQSTGEKLIPFVLKLDATDFDNMIAELRGYREGINISETFVEHSTYWLMNDVGKMLGVVNIRHRLNEVLLQRGGHIGYGIRPSERRKGYATTILRLALQKARDMKLSNVLVTCDKENIASAKTILKNGGVLDSELVEANGNVIQRYWISL